MIHEKEEQNGIAELLEVLGAIIKGLAVPLKTEHLQWLHRILLPLYSAPGYLTYCAQVSYCTTHLINKERDLVIPTVKGLIKNWPRTDSAREVILIQQLEELLCVMQKEQFVRIQEEYFTRIGQCVASQHFLVAERALQVWANNIFRDHIKDQISVAMPILLPYVFR